MPDLVRIRQIWLLYAESAIEEYVYRMRATSRAKLWQKVLVAKKRLVHFIPLSLEESGSGIAVSLLVTGLALDILSSSW